MAGAAVRAVPTPEQLAWADAEVGVIIDLDIEVFVPSYRYQDPAARTPDASAFRPTALDTDQWLAAAHAAGARYAVLVAKHCTGFSLWPTAAHAYSVASSPWRGGRGDIVADFMASCARFGIRPGLYASTTYNAHLGVDNPGRVRSGDPADQARYNAVVETQLRELWTNYGPLFEIWFDGGVLPPERGGPDVVPLLFGLQPQAVVFQGPPGTRSPLRWVGNEAGEAPDPCWGAVSATGDGFAGDPDGEIWAPAEADMPGRDPARSWEGGWFWRAGEDDTCFPADHLVERYYRSVGRNANLLLGMVVDDRGLVPDADVRALTAFGDRIRARFGPDRPSVATGGAELVADLGGPITIDHAVLAEDLTAGQVVRGYTLEAGRGGIWREISRGPAIGHRRIDRFAPVTADRLRLRCTAAGGVPRLRALTAFGT